MKRGIAFLVLSLLSIFASTSTHAKIKGNTVYLDTEFKTPRITKSEYSQQYSHIEIEGSKSFGKAGEPVLPIKGLKALIPPNTKVKSIEIIPGEKIILPGFYIIEPGQKQYPLSKIGKMKIKPDEPNRKIYQSNAPYFKELHKALSPQKKMGYSITIIDLYPVEYNPKEGKIAYYKTMRVAVKVEAESKVLSANEKKTVPRLRISSGTKVRDQKLIQRLIDNKEDLSVYDQELTALASSKSNTTLISAALDPSLKYDYVIITRSDFVSNLEPLKERRTQKGLNATIVTAEWIYANYPGTRPDGKTDDQTKIRNFIIDAYNNWGTEYVLLAGDGDGADVGGESGNTIIPARGLSDPAGGSGYADNNIPADLYYSCLDGTFDKNANGIYGEKTDGETDGEIDLLAEVYVGRICIDSTTEADNFVKKTLAYEDSTNTNLINKNYMVGEALGFGGISNYATANMDEIRFGTNAHGYTTEGFLNNLDHALDAETLYDKKGWKWPKNHLVNVINNGVHVLNHLGHANVDYDMKLYNSDVDAFTNTDYFIAYSQGCYPGSFDNRTTEADKYSSSDCIAEHLTGSVHGAVAFIGNSRYGWGARNSTAGSSQYYNRQFWDALFGEGIAQIGRMNQDSKEDNIPYLYADQNRWCYFEQNLFGDPALEIHTTNTPILAVISNSFIEQVADGLFYPSEQGELITTVKAFNKDTVNASITLSSADPYVSIEQDNWSSAVILKGTSQDNAANPFRFTISKDCPAWHTINFTLKVTTDGYAKEQALVIDVYDPKIRRIIKNTASTSLAISEDKIIWIDSRNDSKDIYLYDLSTNTERRITSGTSGYDVGSRNISGNKIIWLDYRNGSNEIYLYDLSTNIERRIITSDTAGQYVYSPAISGDKIVWLDYRNGNSEIYLYDLSTNTERRITSGTTDQRVYNPAISGDKIIWLDYRNGLSEIYLYDLSTNTERRITSCTTGQYSDSLTISGDKIIWLDDRNDSNEIYLYDLSTNTERRITSGATDQLIYYSAFSGDKIVWTDYNNGSNVISLYDLSTNIERRITVSTAGQYVYSPAISGDKIVWYSGGGDIFLYDLK